MFSRNGVNQKVFRKNPKPKPPPQNQNPRKEKSLAKNKFYPKKYPDRIFSARKKKMPPVDMARHCNMLANLRETTPPVQALRGTPKQLMTKKSKGLRGLQQQPLEVPVKKGC